MEAFSLLWPRIIAVGLVVGFLFGVADALLNANPLARRLYESYRPILRASVNAPLGIAFDLLFGIVMAILFVAFLPSFHPSRILSGLEFGVVAWFFRVAMGAASQLVMFRIPAAALLYTLSTGLAEMLLLGVFLGALLGPE
jgi:hypothetical protein